MKEIEREISWTKSKVKEGAQNRFGLNINSHAVYVWETEIDI